MNVLVSGSNGFVGGAVLKFLYANEFRVKGLVRRKPDFLYDAVEQIECDLSKCDSFPSGLFINVDVVIHCAARAHIIKDNVSDPLTEYRRVNVDGSINLARQAAIAGVKRFIFLSSIGVNGNINTKPFTEKDTPAPAELYAQTKWEAEQALWDVQRETGMELVIIRPPLVYGPSAPGNFGSLIRWVGTGIPLPLGAIKNQRSLVALDNLVDLIITCIDHPSAANQVFLAGDGQDLSTTELLQKVAFAMDKPSRLIPVPKSLLMFGAMLLGKRAVAQRLLGSLQVDISKARDLLGWEPPISVQEGIRRCFEPKSN